MSYPLGRLVSAPDPSATVRYDFSDHDAVAPRAIHADGFTLGAPSLESGPTAISPLYGYRSLAFRHEIGGEKADALAALAVLSRELLRPESWMLVQVDAFTRPTWWRVLASGPEALSFDRVGVDPKTGDPVPGRQDWWEIGVSLTTDPFGYGERIVLDTYTVGQNLASTYPMRVLLPTIRGDAPAALRVDVQAATDNAHTSRYLIGAVSGESVTDLLVDVGIDDDWLAGTGVTGPTADATYVGGSYQTVTITDGIGPDLGSDYYATRVSGSVTLTPGRYKVLVRCEADPVDSTTPQRYLFGFGQTVNGEVRWGDSVQQETPTTVGDPPSVAASFQGWVDLGDHTFPLGVSLPPDVTPGSVSAAVSLRIGTFSGVGVVRLDAFKFIPLDGLDVSWATLLTTRFEAEVTDVTHPTEPLSATASCTWDGDAADGSGLVWMTERPSGDLLASGVDLQGGFPVVDPAASENVLIAFATNRGRSDDADAGTSVDTEWDVAVSYQPRLLHLDGRP